MIHIPSKLAPGVLLYLMYFPQHFQRLLYQSFTECKIYFPAAVPTQYSLQHFRLSAMGTETNIHGALGIDERMEISIGHWERDSFCQFELSWFVDVVLLELLPYPEYQLEKVYSLDRVLEVDRVISMILSNPLFISHLWS